jgi:hypothetical protein
MQGFDPELDALEGNEGELWGEMPGELGELGETFESGEGFEAGEGEGYETSESQRVFDEVEEMELAGALLEVASEGELDRFLGDLVRRASRAVGSVVRSPIGRSLVGILKNAASQALPGVGGLMDAAVGAAGGALGEPTEAGQLFGMELEGMSPEDQEYEVARRFVRFGGAAAANAAQAPPSMPPQAAAGNAAAAAARDHAPGLLGPQGRGRSGRRHARHGRWIRRGRTIVIVNCNSPGQSPAS